MSPLLRVENLVTAFGQGADTLRVVDGVSFQVAAGETYALLGESGCGKSMTALSLMRLLPDGGRIVAGSVKLGEEDVLALPNDATLQQTLNAVCYLNRTTRFDRLVPFDDLEVDACSMLREHLRVPGMGDTSARVFRAISPASSPSCSRPSSNSTVSR